MRGKELTIEEMTEQLHERAEEVFLLSSIATRRHLAHAFCYLMAHVQNLDCQIKPIDANYRVAEGPTENIAKLDVDLGFRDWMDDETARVSFRERIARIDEYQQLLDRIIEAGEPLLNEDEAAA